MDPIPSSFQMGHAGTKATNDQPTEATVAHDVEKLLDFIRSMNWGAAGLSKNTNEIPENDPLKPIYGSIAVIKRGFDALLEETQNAKKRILEENRLNQFRAVLWKLASDKNSGVLDFIHNLLSVIGEFLAIDRASYMKLNESRQWFECKACWKKQYAPSTIGAFVPVSMMERYLELRCSKLSEATLSTPFAAADAQSSETLIFRENFSTLKSYCIPFFINDVLRGIFTLDLCDPRRDFTMEPDMVARIGQEVTTIAAAYIARKNAEDERQAAFTQLEEKILQRTIELVEANTQLATSRKAAESSSEAKSRFLANMSHEIRTPLNAVIGFSEMIAFTSDPKQHKLFAHTIQLESKRLLELLNSILDISKIESGKMDLDLQPFSLSRLIDELASVYGMQTEKKGLLFSKNYDEALPRCVIGDATKTRQVLVNILGNAIKFTARGSIALVISPAPAMGKIRFEVADTGIGMSEVTKRKLFQPFEQADASITRKYGGTGLGTALSLLLVRLMQGDLGVNSEEGKGSTFWFELPLKPAPESFREEASPIGGAVETLRTKHVLLVEDYPPNREIAKFFLSGTGLEVSIAENGAEAVSRVKENRFDLIIMDVQMPVMDGLAASREIRILENGKTVPIIGMTAHAFESDREKCLGAGMNYVITKPVDWPKAIIILQNALQGEIPAHPIEAAEATRPADAESPLDLTAYIQRMNGNKRVALDILAGFLRILPSDIANIAESLKTGNAREANRLAHSIKSGGANVCAAELSEAARRLEESLELGICDDASALWQKLNAVYGRLSDWATVNL